MKYINLLLGLMILSNVASAFTATVKRNTEFKEKPIDRATLYKNWFETGYAPSECAAKIGNCLVEVKRGTKLDLVGQPRIIENGHYFIETKAAIKSYLAYPDFVGCQFRCGYIPVNDISFFNTPAPTPVPVPVPRPTPTPKPTIEPVFPTILLYHDIVASRDDISSSSDVAILDFKAQISFLIANGYSFYSIDQLHKNWLGLIQLNKKAAIITFDDGYLGNYDYAYPYLKQMNLPATFFVHTEYVGVTTSKEHVTWDHLKEMSGNRLFEIGSHTRTHRKLSELSDADQRNEIVNSKRKIDRRLGIKTRFFAYPLGDYDNRALSLVERYYDLAFSVARYSSDIYNRTTIPRFSIGTQIQSIEDFERNLKVWEGRFK